jgi:hypothetical protein
MWPLLYLAGHVAPGAVAMFEYFKDADCFAQIGEW